MDVRAYFDRIGYKGPLAPTVETLRTLHRQHMLTRFLAAIRNPANIKSSDNALDTTC